MVALLAYLKSNLNSWLTSFKFAKEKCQKTDSLCFHIRKYVLLLNFPFLYWEDPRIDRVLKHLTKYCIPNCVLISICTYLQPGWWTWGDIKKLNKISKKLKISFSRALINYLSPCLHLLYAIFLWSQIGLLRKWVPESKDNCTTYIILIKYLVKMSTLVISFRD